MQLGYLEMCGHICSRAQPIVGAQKRSRPTQPRVLGKHCHKTLLGQMTIVIGLSYLPVWQLCEPENLVAIDDRCT